MKVFKIIYHIATFIVLCFALLIVQPIIELLYSSFENGLEGVITILIINVIKDLLLWNYVPSIVLLGAQGFMYKLPVVSLIISAINIFITAFIMFGNGIVSFIGQIEAPYFDMAFMVNLVPLLLSVLTVGLNIFFIVDKRKKKLMSNN